MNRRAVRRLKKQDKANPGARRQRAVEASQRNRNLEAINSNLSARQAAIEAPSVKEVGKGLDGGDAPEEVANDSGRGTHMEYPGLACTGTVSNHEGDRPCRAKFHTQAKHAAHMAEVHPENPVQNPTLF
jgi:hypothetical protein